MAPAENSPPYTLGLWGDGDEAAAIRDVERRFNVSLVYSDARHWVTVGDVFIAVQRELPPAQAEAAETWSIFAEAIAAETGVDPIKLKPQTVLLGKKRVGWWLSLLVAAMASLMLALILH